VSRRVGAGMRGGRRAGGGVAVAEGGWNEALVGIGNRDGVVPVAPLAVLIGKVVEAGRLEGGSRSLGMSGPQIREDATHRDRAILAVQRAIEVHVALDLLVVGQHLLPAPTTRPARDPFLEVGGSAAIGELAVDR